MGKVSKIIVKYQLSDMSVYLVKSDTEKRLLNNYDLSDSTIEHTKNSLYELTNQLRKKFNSAPIEINIKNAPKDVDEYKWKTFVNEFFATTGIGLIQK